MMRRMPCSIAACACAVTAACAAPRPPSAAPSGAGSRPAAVARPAPPGPLPRVAMPDPPASERVLSSGLRVVVVEQHGRPAAIVSLVLPRGATSDAPANAGATWLAVQLASDYREVSESGEELVDEKSFRRQVAELGGSTWFDVEPDASVLSISGYASDAGGYLRLLADAVTAPRRGEDSFTQRRNALLDGLEDLETSDPEVLNRVLTEAAFGRGHPYARSIVGTLATLRRLGHENVVAQQDRILVPRGATLLVVGDVDPQRTFREAAAAFARWQRGPPATEPAFPAPAAVAAPDVVFLQRAPASTLLVCAARPVTSGPGDDAAVEVLAAIAGEGLGSRLSLALRERAGLTYGANAGVVRLRHASAFLACSAVSAARASAAVSLFRDTLAGLRAAPPRPDELARAKALRRAALDAARADLVQTAAAWRDALARGLSRPRTAEERAALERVTAADVQRVASELLRPDALHWILSGDRAVAAAAVAANRLPPMRAWTLGR